MRLDPNSFIAHLKMGELWMRLRVMDKAEEHTQRAGSAGQNIAQAELARRQDASIRAMKQAGIERGGYKSPWLISDARYPPSLEARTGVMFLVAGRVQLIDAAGPSTCPAAGDPACRRASLPHRSAAASEYRRFWESCWSACCWGRAPSICCTCIYLQAGKQPSALLLLAQVGGFVLMFIAGVETDVDRMREAGTTAFLVALFGVIWPFLLGAGVGHLFGLSWITSCFLGGALTATSVSISARTLMDAGQMSSAEGTVILGAAVIDDVMGLVRPGFSRRLDHHQRRRVWRWRRWPALGCNIAFRPRRPIRSIVQMIADQHMRDISFSSQALARQNAGWIL